VRSRRYHQLESDFADGLLLLFSTPSVTITAPGPTESDKTDLPTEDDTVMRDDDSSADARSDGSSSSMEVQFGEVDTVIDSVMAGLSLTGDDGSVLDR
jgi:hypothetical protein